MHAQTSRRLTAASEWDAEEEGKRQAIGATSEEKEKEVTAVAFIEGSLKLFRFSEKILRAVDRNSMIIYTVLQEHV